MTVEIFQDHWGVLTNFFSKNGNAEQEARTASAIVQPNPGLNVPWRPCAWSFEPLNTIGDDADAGVPVFKGLLFEHFNGENLCASPLSPSIFQPGIFRKSFLLFVSDGENIEQFLVQSEFTDRCPPQPAVRHKSSCN
jgi:hypothetical protein